MTLNTIATNSILTKECEALSASPFLAFTLKMDRFQNAPFSNLCVFISVFKEHVNARQKPIRFATFSFEDGAVRTGPKSVDGARNLYINMTRERLSTLMFP